MQINQSFLTRRNNTKLYRLCSKQIVGHFIIPVVCSSSGPCIDCLQFTVKSWYKIKQHCNITVILILFLFVQYVF